MDSLSAVGLDDFRNEIIASGLEETLSETPGVTIFAPSNFTSGAFNISTHVITNGFLGFLPQLFDTTGLRTDSGLPISLTFEDGMFYINGIRIIRADIIVKNGVVYEIEQVETLHTACQVSAADIGLFQATLQRGWSLDISLDCLRGVVWNQGFFSLSMQLMACLMRDGTLFYRSMFCFLAWKARRGTEYSKISFLNGAAISIHMGNPFR
jgi:hypothetical protein